MGRELGCAKNRLTWPPWFRAESLRDQKLEGLAHQLLAAVAELLLGLTIHQEDPSLRPDDHHRVRRSIDQLLVRLDSSSSV